MGSEKEDVLTKTATETGVSKNTIQRARAYVKAVNKEPEKYKGKKISQVLKSIKIEKQQAILLVKSLSDKTNISTEKGKYMKK